MNIIIVLFKESICLNSIQKDKVILITDNNVEP